MHGRRGARVWGQRCAGRAMLREPTPGWGVPVDQSACRCRAAATPRPGECRRRSGVAGRRRQAHLRPAPRGARLGDHESGQGRPERSARSSYHRAHQPSFVRPHLSCAGSRTPRARQRTHLPHARLVGPTRRAHSSQSRDRPGPWLHPRVQPGQRSRRDQRFRRARQGQQAQVRPGLWGCTRLGVRRWRGCLRPGRRGRGPHSMPGVRPRCEDRCGTSSRGPWSTDRAGGECRRSRGPGRAPRGRST